MVRFQQMIRCLVALCASSMSVSSAHGGILVEAESFANKGQWVVDQQFMDTMGSSYLLAHGMGHAVGTAQTQIAIDRPGCYEIYVRTYNWTAPWHDGEGPGRFTLSVNGQIVGKSLGGSGKKWMWQKVGEINIESPGPIDLALQDLTGFDGRCDAIYLTDAPGDIPPNQPDQLREWRIAHGTIQAEPTTEEFDFVVAGGGIAGMCAAVSAARLGLKTALINDRPVLGGNNSSEIRVHLGGRIAIGPYPQLGNLIKEFGPTRSGNAQPAEFYEDAKKQQWIDAEKNITLFSSFRVNQVEKQGNRIVSITAQQIESGKRVRFQAPLFADCTGDGTVGFLAGASWMMGRETRSEYNEPTAPAQADAMTMGASIQWYSVDRKRPISFPQFTYGLKINESNAEKVTMGEWDWETGMNLDQIQDAEIIRDYGLLVVYSNWSFLKNEWTQRERFANRELEWVSFLAGKRESRRLKGDLVLTENDLRNRVIYPDATAASSWSIDLHYPMPQNHKNFPFSAFRSVAKHIVIHFYPIPYRCLYSKDIDNLFMAGRHISVTHVALGTTRVMRTTGMLGEVVGMAASLCKTHNATPRQIYQNHLPELKILMQQGTGKHGLPNNQRYNMGGSLSQDPADCKTSNITP